MSWYQDSSQHFTCSQRNWTYSWWSDPSFGSGPLLGFHHPHLLPHRLLDWQTSVSVAVCVRSGKLPVTVSEWHLVIWDPVTTSRSPLHLRTQSSWRHVTTEPFLQHLDDERLLTTMETLHFLSVVLLIELEQCKTNFFLEVYNRTRKGSDENRMSFQTVVDCTSLHWISLV